MTAFLLSPSPKFLSLVAIGTLVGALAGCPEDVVETPDSLDSPFRMPTDSLAFPNFAVGYDESKLTVEGMQRMFGDVVCQEDVSPCALTPEARVFLAEANLAMTGGRCEGFAVLSVLMSDGEISPDDFGGTVARELVLDDNPALQREIAYWFSTQLLPSAVTEQTQGYAARDVMPVLTEALAEDATERLRIGIVRKEGEVYTGGHSLTPLGFYRDPDAPSVYWLRVYDNNLPDAERLLKVDTERNRWEYEASANPSEASRLYFGDASNDNPLWLAPISTRTGIQACHFCDGEGAQVSSYGGAQLGLEFPDGVAGFTDEGLELIEGVGVTPSFSAGLDSEPLALRISVSPARANEVEGRIIARVKAFDDAANPNARQRVHIAQGRLSATVSNLEVTAEDRFVVTRQSASFENASRSGLTLRTVLSDGHLALAVAVTVARGSDKVETTIDPELGGVVVTVEGAEDDEVVAVEVTATDAEGQETVETVTFPVRDEATFEANTADFVEEGGVLEAVVRDADGVETEIIGGCFDSAQNGDETDIDCGGGCAEKCATGQGCAAPEDCATGSCNVDTGVCVADHCSDGAQNEGESGVDCGGTCPACAAGSGCDDDDDCSGTSRCVVDTCVPTFAVGVSVTGLHITDSMVLQNNGGDDLVVDADGSFTFFERVTGEYAVTILTAPERSRCEVVDGAGTATENIVVTVTCDLGFTIGGTLTGLEAGETIRLALDAGETLDLTADGPWEFSGRTLGDYSVTIDTSPDTQFCSIANGDGTAATDVTDVAVQCCPPGVIGAACDACYPGHGTAPPACTLPACGDGILDPGESCDDANTNDSDGCSSTCEIEDGYSCSNPVQVNTGSDNAGGRAALNSNDLVWSWSEDIDSARTPATVAGNCAPPSWVAPDPYADWVNRYGCAINSPFANTTWYHATFTIPTAEAAAATNVAGRVWADNRIEDIVVNGVSTGIASEGEIGFAGPGISFGDWPSALYQAGVNTISVGVENQGTEPNPDGLLVQVPNAFGLGSVCTLD